LDLRINHNELELGIFEGSVAQGKTGAKRQHFQVYCDYKGDEIGSITFYAYEGWPLNKIDSYTYKSSEVVPNLLYINEVRVHDKYQNLGIGQLLYKKFGELYEERFKNWPIGRMFVNPIAEYAYRKAVGLGYISEVTLDETYIGRDYDEDYKPLMRDLRNKLPEHVKGPETWAKVANKDVRNIEVKVKNSNNYELYSQVEEFENFEGYEIDIYVNDKKIGSLDFCYMENAKYKDELINKLICINVIDVEEEYQNLGFGTRLYQEFGKIYNEKYNGIPVARYFINPIAEYSFRKAVALGYVSEHALSEDYIGRFYTSDNKQLIKDLRNKLPEHIRGPEVWSKVSSNDVRNVIVDYQVKDENDPNLESLGVTNIKNHNITLKTPNDNIIGSLSFIEYNNIPIDIFGYDKEGIADKILNIDKIEVKNHYRQLGFGTRLYQEFGKIYDEKFNGVPVARYFINPIAEYSFRKAVSLGYVSENALNEDYISRGYNTSEKIEQAKDLRNKLPEEFKGPSVWAKIKNKLKKK